MAKQDKAVDWAARLRAALVPAAPLVTPPAAPPVTPPAASLVAPPAEPVATPPAAPLATPAAAPAAEVPAAAEPEVIAERDAEDVPGETLASEAPALAPPEEVSSDAAVAAQPAPIADPFSLLAAIIPGPSQPGRAPDSPLLAMLGAQAPSLAVMSPSPRPAPSEPVPEAPVEAIEAQFPMLVPAPLAPEAGPPARPEAEVLEERFPMLAVPGAAQAQHSPENAPATTTAPPIEAAAASVVEAAPVAEPEAAPAAAPEAAVAAEPEPTPAPEPEPSVVAEPESASAAAPEPAVVAEPEPAPAPEPEPAVASEPEPAPAAEPEPAVAAAPEAAVVAAPAAPQVAADSPAADPALEAEADPDPTPAAADPAADPLGHASIAAAYLAVRGTPVPAGEAPAGADWLAVALSLEQARDHWRALFLGAGPADLPAAGAGAARRAGLTPVLHVAEAHPGLFGQIQAAVEAEGLEEQDTMLLQAVIGADEARLPPRGALAQGLIEAQESWDLLRVGTAHVVGQLLIRALPLLTERVRWLAVAPVNRGEEAAAVRMLRPAGWTLRAERPAAIRLTQPNTASQAGVQIWRGPLD